jgi:RimJ/RimL family protein N-acetyltransferase
MIEGNITNLRDIRKSDLKYIEGWINDSEIQYYSQEEYPVYYNKQLINILYRDAVSGKIKVFIIEDKLQNIIGELWIYPIDYLRKYAEFEIVIGRKDMQNKGYGKDAINTAKKYCFEELELNKIYLKVFSFNVRAIRCYKSCGFKITGKIGEMVERYGILHDEYIMEAYK